MALSHTQKALHKSVGLRATYYTGRTCACHLMLAEIAMESTRGGVFPAPATFVFQVLLLALANEATII